MMTKYKIEILGKSENAIRFRLKKTDQYLTFKEVFNLWEHSNEFIKFYVAELLNLNFKAIYWEHPVLKKEYLTKKYECIVRRSQTLEHLRINEQAFKAYIYSSKEAEDFLNLGKNARLIIPTKKTNEEIYNHLAKFLRLADQIQIRAVFNSIGRVVKEEIEKGQTIWLNTAGLGVIWLHIRMDTRPKYYKTEKYKQLDFWND